MGERGSCIPLQQCPSLVNSNRYQLYQCGHTNNPRNPYVLQSIEHQIAKMIKK